MVSFVHEEKRRNLGSAGGNIWYEITGEKTAIPLIALHGGPEEFNASGTLKSFDLVPRLKEINVPVLLLCGRFDEATPEALEMYKTKLPDAKLQIFEKSAHMPHWTEGKASIYITLF